MTNPRLLRDHVTVNTRIPAETLRRFWTMLAHVQGGTLNASRLAAGLGVTGQTVSRYLDLLVDLLLVRRLQPWASSTGKRLVRSPKVYVRDSGLVHALLNLGDQEALLGHPVVGPSWEGFVVENLIAAAPEGAEPFFYRTSAGAEIDLVLAMSGGELWAFEIKRSLSPKPARGFFNACEDLGVVMSLVVYPGAARYPVATKTDAMRLPEALVELRRST